jgi:hypothetical protein
MEYSIDNKIQLYPIKNITNNLIILEPSGNIYLIIIIVRKKSFKLYLLNEFFMFLFKIHVSVIESFR